MCAMERMRRKGAREDRTAGVERRGGGSDGASNGDEGREDLAGLFGA